jgi:type III secretion protein J
MKSRLSHLLIALSIVLSGCQDVLFSKLSEPQANEVLAALAEARIGASKERVDDSNWRVHVASDRVGEALVFLRDRGLPVRPSPTMGEVFKKDGMVSTPMEERARYAWALQESIASTLRRIDGVTEARVHVALPHNDPLADRAVPPSASVFLKHRRTLDVDVLTPQIKSMVMASVEGLDYRNISLFAYPVDARPLSTSVRHAESGAAEGWIDSATALLPSAHARSASPAATPTERGWPASAPWSVLLLSAAAAVCASVVWWTRRRGSMAQAQWSAEPASAGGAAPRSVAVLTPASSSSAFPEGIFAGSARGVVASGTARTASARHEAAAQALAVLPRQGAARSCGVKVKPAH